MKQNAQHIHLTPRQSQIVVLICQGETNKEIGKRLKISHRTVEVHRTAVNRKFGVNNVAGLIRAAVQQGWVKY